MAKVRSIVNLLNRLPADPIRAAMPFSPEIDDANRTILACRSDAAVAKNVLTWLRVHQPCIFGRMAAGRIDLTSVCVLTERDLFQADSAIMEKIQRDRLEWRRQALRGRRSAFIILATAPQLINAAPGKELQDFALRLAELYLLRDITPDTVFLEHLWLQIADEKEIEWEVGVNYFGVQGDGRWWRDHRIPAGIALSMNSVGHMVRSGHEHNAVELGLAQAAGEDGRKSRKPIDRLDVALRYAMLTINRATDGVSGKGTCLKPIAAELAAGECPLVDVPPELFGKDWTTYSGWYHTDHTIPSVYFRPDVVRPAEVQELDLDFTYLYSPDNLDFFRMGPGVRTR